MPDDPNQGSLELFDDSGVSFEGLAKTNGTRYWLARDFMVELGYDSWSVFKNVINKAIGVCLTTGIPLIENFIQCNRTVNSRELEDYKLTRLACCLIAMNADSSIPAVARAQVYFAALDQVAQELLVIHAESMDRIVARGEISEREITLSKTATQAGLENHSQFQNEGYRGMYNRSLLELKKLKGMKDLSLPLLDFMGKDELAGNLFRLSLTEGRIKKESVRGQKPLEHVAHDVGATVRKMMIEQTGKTPESLPIGPDIKIVKKALKGTVKSFSQMDDLARERACEAEVLALMPAPIDGVFPDCPECQAGSELSHRGSADCNSGSIAAGGDVAHCSCDICSER